MRFYVTITREEFDLLSRMAWQERRIPREQAAVLLAQALRSVSRRDQRRSQTNDHDMAREVSYANAT